MKEVDFKYWAFISYSHQDNKWGDWLHKALETYRVPTRLVGEPLPDDGTIPKRLIPIFRDREELPTATDLGQVITEALEQSRYLIVICSPRSAQSHWVNEEILAFKRMGKASRIMALIVDGEPNASDKPELGLQECFPDALKYELDSVTSELSGLRTEPIAGDARDQGDGKRDAILKLVAGLVGVGFDEIRQREMQRRQKRLVVLASTTSVIMLAMVALVVWALIAQRAAVDAQNETAAALKKETVAKNKAMRSNYSHVIALADSAIRDGNFTRARKLLATCPVDFRHFEWHHLRALTSHSSATLRGHGSFVKSVAFSTDGKRIVSGSGDNTIKVWDAVNGGEALLDLTGHDAGVLSVALSADGKRLVSGSQDNTIKVWDAENGDEALRTLVGH